MQLRCLCMWCNRPHTKLLVITHINYSGSSLLLDLLTTAHHLCWIQQLFNLPVFLSVVFFKTAQLGFHLVRFSLLGLDGLRKRRGNMWVHAISVCILLVQKKLHSMLVIGNQTKLLNTEINLKNHFLHLHCTRNCGYY